MKYQLVLQLPTASIQDYDHMIEIEGAITRSLGDMGDVDGHDMGAGEMNIFIYTDRPAAAFEQIKRLLGTKDFMPELKAAYRERGKSGFSILHPEGLTSFKIA